MKAGNKKKIFLSLFFTIFAVGLFLQPVSQVFAFVSVIHIPEKYKDIFPGERFYFEMGINYPENPTRKDLNFEYNITKDGEIIYQSEVLKSIEKQASFTDYLVLPNSAEKGTYEIRVKITDNENLNEETFANFNVKSKDNSIFYYFLVLAGAIIAFATFVLIEIRKLSKN